MHGDHVRQIGGERVAGPRPKIRAVTNFGLDNQIDGFVLNVLLRKHKAVPVSVTCRIVAKRLGARAIQT